MAFTSSRERFFWRAAGICLLVIYSSLYIARPITEFLRERNLLRAVVGLIFVSAGAAVVGMVRRWRPGWRILLGLIAAALLYVPVFVFLHLPEERLHYLQYGLVCGLVHAAMRERRLHRPVPESATTWTRVIGSSWFVALVLTSAAGWLDEGIQKLLPNRFYDLRDVAFNVSAAMLYLLAFAVVDAARRWEARSRPGARGIDAESGG